MSENQLAKNIAYYRKKRGLSQEKVSEYIGVSRQAVTKWENNVSRPSSDNLIKLSQLFEVSIDALLDNGNQEKTSTQTEIAMGKMPWFFIGISVLCILIYVIKSALSGIFSIGTLILMFTLCVPIQLFWHIYFSNAINNDFFTGIAGFDDKVEYNICEVMKLLVQINLHIGIMSTIYVFLLCVTNCVNGQIKWLNVFLIVTYLLGFVITVEIINYRMIDKIYSEDNDKKRARRSIPITVIYILLLFIGIGMLIAMFEIKGIENNTIPAMELAGLLILGIIIATVGFLFENDQIKKWNPANENYKINKIGIISLYMRDNIWSYAFCMRHVNPRRVYFSKSLVN